MQELVLRDNKLAKVPDVSIFTKLLVYDISFNEITSLEGISKASSTLKELYVSKNEVNKIMEIEHLHNLQILELGSNRLRVCPSLLFDIFLFSLQCFSNEFESIEVSGDGKSGKLHKIRRTMARKKPYQSC